jgi:hypothetical protein
MKKLHFSININAPKAKVWDKMISEESYREWTSVFAEGSSFKGSWDKGAKILFVDPSNSGMVAEIAENKLHEFISIRHLGEIDHGVEDTTSEKVKAWTPAYENYTLTEKDGVTTVDIELDSADAWAGMMGDMWPKALLKLKDICE